jgi:hypothetical protein
MDDQFFVPGTNIRFGLDSILGLFPGLGDVITSEAVQSRIQSSQEGRRAPSSDIGSK